MADLALAMTLILSWSWLRNPLSPRQWWYRNIYLWSPHWRRLRLRKLAEVGYRCKACGHGGRLDVHHLTYKRVGRERLADLQVLCRGCHGKKH